jgi:hypothetical protein
VPHEDLVNHGAAQLVRILVRVHVPAGGVGSHRAEFSRGIVTAVLVGVPLGQWRGERIVREAVLDMSSAAHPR